MKLGNDEMHRGIDALAKAIPDGQLMAAMGPLAFLGAAAEHIKALTAEVDRLREALQMCVDDYPPGAQLVPDSIINARRTLGEQPKERT
jgi:hypothetical protein